MGWVDADRSLSEAFLTFAGYLALCADAIVWRELMARLHGDAEIGDR